MHGAVHRLLREVEDGQLDGSILVARPSSSRFTSTSMPGCATSGTSTWVATAMPCSRRTARTSANRHANESDDVELRRQRSVQ